MKIISLLFEQIRENAQRLTIALLSFFIYSLLFFLLIPFAAQGVTALSLIPIITISMLFSLRTGILTALIIIPINIFFLNIGGVNKADIIAGTVPGAIGSIFIAAAAGYMSGLHRKSKLQLEQLQIEKTERKKAEEKLFEIQGVIRENLNKGVQENDNTIINHHLNVPEKIYREIAENAADIIYIMDIEGYFNYMNKMGLINTGYSKEELYSYKYTDLILPGYKDKVKRFYLKQYIKKDGSTYLEFPFRSKDGTLKWYGQNATLMYANDKITGFSVIARDITERKQIEISLKENEERLRLITQTAYDAIISTDSSFSIMHWNMAAQRIFGYEEKEVIGKSLEMLMPEGERGEFFNQLNSKDLLQNEFVPNKTFERNGLRKDGSVFKVEVSLAEWISSGNIYYTYIIRDISDRKEAELKLTQSERDYRQLFLSAHEPILVFNPDDETILEANDKACEVYGYDRSEFIGLSLKKLSLDVERGESKVSETLNAGSLINFETTQYRKDGKKLFFDVNASITEYKGRKAILSINRDMTEKVEAEKNIRLLASAIESTSEIISLTDVDNRFIFINKAFLDTYGYTEEEVLGKTPFIVASEKNPPDTTANILTSTREGNWSGVLFNKKKNGNEFLISLNTSRVYDNQGNTLALVGIARDITSEILANEKVKESEERYRVLFENNPLPVIAYDFDDSSVLAVNRAAVSHYGYSEAEFLRMKAGAIVCADCNDSIHRNYLFLNGENGTDKTYQVHKKKDGSNISVEISTYRMVLNERVVVISIINDITRRIEVEKEIIKQRDTAQRYLDISAVLMCALDINGNVILINKTGCQVLGYKEEEIIGKNWIELCFKEELHEELTDVLCQIMFSDNALYEYYESSVITKEGKERIIAFHNTAIYEEDGGVLGVLFSGEDITDRKMAEKELEDYRNHLEKLVSERTDRLKELNHRLFYEVKKLTEADDKIQNQIEFFKTLINTIPLPVFIRDMNKIYVDCNQSFENFFGVKRHQLIGKSVFDIFSREIALVYEEKDNKILSGSSEEYFEINAVDKEGALHEVIVYQAAYYKKDGTADGTVGVMLDITPQKNMQREIKKSLEKEKDLSELKSRFISSASHEFRTPLTTILASADLLEILGPTWSEEKFKGHIAKIQNAVSYMTELIDDVLLINKAETGKLTFNPSEGNLAELVKEVVDDARTIAAENHLINMVYELESEIYLIDKKLLTQILSNLLSNAIKYSPAGGDIKFKITGSGLNIRFDVSDNGIGISEDDIKHLFEPFHRGKNTGNIKGTGLGLSIVKKAVDLHGGKLSIESILNKGTTFSVLIPVIEAV
ncbi:MAG: PAS domain S-box protein [Ignavibacteriaceae bacterium]